MENKNLIIKNALISVYNKKNITNFAKKLTEKKVNIFTTNNTEKFLKKKNINTTNVSKITKYTEMLNGKIKTLHPKIFFGILGKKKDLENHTTKSIIIFDIVVVNFTPINIVQDNKTIEDNIDIGGPAMIKAAMKNYKNTIVIVDYHDYERILQEINTFNNVCTKTKLELAKKACEYIINYEHNILKHFHKKLNKLNQEKSPFYSTIYLKLYKEQELKYGENPNQKAALYTQKKNIKNGSIDSFKQINGTKLSYNNIYDAHIANECVNQFTHPACAIIKHGTPCGVSTASHILSAYSNAYTSDPISAFGGIIGINTILTKSITQKIMDTQFVELIIAPEITSKALKIIKKNKKIKLLICGNYKNNIKKEYEFKNIREKILIQEKQNIQKFLQNWEIVSIKQPTDIEKKHALFCWKVAQFVKSNAIVYSYKFQTIGIGSGQTNRLESVKIANNQLDNNQKNKKKKYKNIIMASDAFFPFRDSIDECKKKNHAITCIIQPGGSIRDKEIIQAANDYNICMIFTKNRIFRH
ncbi:bifunctional phosphoribosylaminoimidazolecarboxamide formyltransferase/IMP cyclohydrolase [Buchnera aphidicola]|uniref:bifunctional phosphoribosylaminoimidazolecarboxamide formyltransferase/IMP cyclohydrolase n=1 Tax=Buchnera aphidicola TaxID=9 RepID=UPI0031B84E10